MNGSAPRRGPGPFSFWKKRRTIPHMATEADVRKIALALEGVSEVDHWGRPSYRTKARIFAVM